MNGIMTPQLNTELKQELKLTPEMILSVKLLQMDQLELSEYIQQELMSNPVLEDASNQLDGEDTSDNPYDDKDLGKSLTISELDERMERYSSEDNYDRIHDRRDDDKIGGFESYISVGESLAEHLLNQLSCISMKPAMMELCENIIGEMDSRGYIHESTEEIAEQFNSTPEAVEDAIAIIQGMEPAGVGARSISECLIIQLKELGALTELLERIISESIEDIAENRVKKIAKNYKIDIQTTQSIIDVIRGLEPNPGRPYTNDRNNYYVVPDLFLAFIDDEPELFYNEGDIPRVQVSAAYKEIHKKSKDNPDVAKYLGEHIQSAERLISNINRRRSTIMSVAEVVVRHQRDYLAGTSRSAKPLNQQQVADELGIHLSTVSRAISGKYLQCSCGVCAMKDLFASGGIESAEGESHGQTELKAQIRKLIEDEDKSKPISDQKIADIMASDGIDISRRTVAKYRESMGIESTSKRRRY